MPPTRSTKRTTSSGTPAQSTLSFSNKNKVTKPAPKSKSTKDLFPKPSQDSDASNISSKKGDDVGHVTSEVAIKKQVEKEKERPRTEKERDAERVSDAQVKRYWKERESERITKRVHQNDLSLEEKVLRLFDMSSQYGPAIGIARMKRWNRAFKLGLNPPIEVLAVLLKEEKKGNTKIERAHVDELMSSKFVIGDA